MAVENSGVTLEAKEPPCSFWCCFTKANAAPKAGYSLDSSSKFGCVKSWKVALVWRRLRDIRLSCCWPDRFSLLWLGWQQNDCPGFAYCIVPVPVKDCDSFNSQGSKLCQAGRLVTCKAMAVKKIQWSPSKVVDVWRGCHVRDWSRIHPKTTLPHTVQ